MVDIVTHAAIGCVLAAPWLGLSPELAVGIAFGSVLPDLDACSRLAGKRAFLAFHQTWSHALPSILLVGILVGVVAGALGHAGAPLGLGLAVGMLVHSLLDLTNTYGIALWLPFSRRRWCREWLFFIDLGTMMITGASLAWIGWIIAVGQVPGWEPTAAWLGAMLCWLAIRAWLRRKVVRRMPPGLVAMIPSSWLPWRFYGTIEEPGATRLVTVDVWSSHLQEDRRVPHHDAECASVLAAVPEVGIMRTLTPAYHVVAVAQTEEGIDISCRDLRTRNFATVFGACDIAVRGGSVRSVVFHV